MVVPFPVRVCSGLFGCTLNLIHNLIFYSTMYWMMTGRKEQRVGPEVAKESYSSADGIINTKRRHTNRDREMAK